jgi:hypothetical protein
MTHNCMWLQQRNFFLQFIATYQPLFHFISSYSQITLIVCVWSLWLHLLNGTWEGGTRCVLSFLSYREIWLDGYFYYFNSLTEFIPGGIGQMSSYRIPLMCSFMTRKRGNIWASKWAKFSPLFTFALNIPWGAYSRSACPRVPEPELSLLYPQEHTGRSRSDHVNQAHTQFL